MAVPVEDDEAKKDRRGRRVQVRQQRQQGARAQTVGEHVESGPKVAICGGGGEGERTTAAAAKVDTQTTAGMWEGQGGEEGEKYEGMERRSVPWRGASHRLYAAVARAGEETHRSSPSYQNHSRQEPGRKRGREQNGRERRRHRADAHSPKHVRWLRRRAA